VSKYPHVRLGPIRCVVVTPDTVIPNFDDTGVMEHVSEPIRTVIYAFAYLDSEVSKIVKCEETQEQILDMLEKSYHRIIDSIYMNIDFTQPGPGRLVRDEGESSEKTNEN
jgi:hypothetical protein